MQLTTTLPTFIVILSALFTLSFSPTLQCPSEVKAQNSSQQTITILLGESEVMTKGGAWDNLFYGADQGKHCAQKALKLNPGAKVASTMCQLARTCEFPRRFRLKLKVESGGRARYFTHYFPSSTGFTSAGSTEIDLGDLARHVR